MQTMIPYFPTLGPRAGWKTQHRAALPYPLSHDRVRRYYMGRSGVYYGSAALGLKPGDEVLLPSYHSGTETAPLAHYGCRLKFYGVSRDLNIDLDEIEDKISPATRALYAIHFIGFPGPVAELRAMADRHGIVLIEDCAQAFLSRWGGRSLGTWGDASVFCVYKSLPIAAGGVLAINNDSMPAPLAPRSIGLYSELNLTAKHLLNYLSLHGGAAGARLRWLAQRLAGGVVATTKLECVTPEAMAFDPSVLDWGLGPISAWLLRYFDYDAIARRRRENYRWLADRLIAAGLSPVRDSLPDDTVPLFLPLFVPNKFETVARLRHEGVMAVPFWGRHHEHLPRGEFRDTEFLVDHVIELPIYQDLTVDHLERVADVVLRHTRPLHRASTSTRSRARQVDAAARGTRHLELCEAR
jgi:hypothetical protein